MFRTALASAWFWGLAALFSATPFAHAADELPPEVERPAFMDRKSYMPDFLLKDKKEGWYITAVPAVGYDDEEGFILGIIGDVFDAGSRQSPFYRSTPYRTRISVAGTVTTEDVLDLVAGLDMPYVAGTPFRLRAAVAHTRNPLNNYFGIGDETMGKLRFPGADQGFDEWDDYDRALSRERDGEAYTRYVQWEEVSTLGSVVLERDMVGGRLRPLLGLRFGHTAVDDYTGKQVDARDENGKKVKAEQLPTKLREDHDAGIIDGFEGGWDNFVKLGLSWDTRDFEPDPRAGVLAQITGELATGLLGADFDYQRVTTSVAAYHSLIPQITQLVLGGRALYQMQFGEVPFFSQNTIAFNQIDRNGLGGFRTLRGFKRDRFVGDSAVVLNGDLRWSITEGMWLKQHFRPMLAVFVDAGRVFDDVGFSFDDWRFGYGVGFRFGWNLATVVSFDYGRSGEGDVFYMSFGHSF